MKKICILFILTILTYGALSMANSDSTKSAHFDGKMFHNLDPTIKLRGLISSIKWRFTSKREKWPDQVPLEQEDIPPMLVEKGVRVSFIGHATFLIQTAGLNIITDPVYSERCSPVSWTGPKRVTEPGVSFDKLPKIDVVLVSHNHYDHMDIDTLKMIVQKWHPIIVTPLANATIIMKHIPEANIQELDWYKSFEIKKNIKIYLEPAQHWSARGIFDLNKSLWGSFVIDTPKGQIVFLGDTGYDQAMFKDTAKRFPNIILSMIPIGAYEPRWFMEPVHMNPEEAVNAHLDLKSQRSIASHFATFQLSDEGYDRPSLDLEDAKKKLGAGNFDAMKIGQFVEF